ncbi:MAG: GNA1162 family protein [Bacteroidales bacterium]
MTDCRRMLVPAVLTLALAACGTPSYVDRGKGEEPSAIRPNEVLFTLHDGFRTAPPACVAVLPLQVNVPENDLAEQAPLVRRVLFGHLAPQGRRGVPLARVDHVVGRMAADKRGDLRALGEALNCDALLTGEVVRYGSEFLGVYSRVAVGAKLRLVRAATGEVLWEGEHVATSHGGSLPLSPVGLALGIVDAAGNVSEEQHLRLTDDLARRLVSTIPDAPPSELDDPAAPAPRLVEAPAPAEQAEALAAAGDYAGALAAADRLVAAQPERADAHFLRGRMLLKLERGPEAEQAMIRAAALDGANPRYLDGLGHVNALAGRAERALAAYAMAIKADVADGFAWYNSGVLLLEGGRAVEAGDAFYGAGLAYLKRGDYGMAAKSLAALRDLNGRGLGLDREITTIESALGALPGVKTS